METQHIEYFLAICDELNFTHAAKTCGVAQPTITVAIQRMERKVGGALFQRLPHPPYVQLTALGRQLYPICVQISKLHAKAQTIRICEDKKIPVISGWSEFAQSGGLMTYGPNSSKLFRRLAAYVKKIVAGAKPSEIPIEQPTIFELVINLKTAKSISLTVPPTLIARADEVIE